MIEITNLPIVRGNVPLRVARGHFATSHSHINYYIDIAKQKSRLSEAKQVAKFLAKKFNANTWVDWPTVVGLKVSFTDVSLPQMVMGKPWAGRSTRVAEVME